jgi:2-polyprenyl-3-methyl-5-hydroxy-6-metoxy-1,4-benzoquinol methylase
MKSSVTTRRLQMSEAEDEAFDDLAKRQGDWGLQGSRKHQIMRYVENKERNDVIEEVAKELDQFAGAFGRDTVQSFAAFVRNMKK